MDQPELITFSKPALTFKDQLGLLERRGMEIRDRQAALRTLSQISYYRLSAYWYPFRSQGQTGNALNAFKPGTTFESAVEMYEFDRHLRLCVLDAIERVEVRARTAITYELAHVHGAFAHTLPSIFKSTFEHPEWCEGLDEEVHRSANSSAFLTHYRSKYDGFPRIPIWMATEVMTFGSLSKLFKSGMAKGDVEKVSEHLGVHASVMPSWLHALSFVRNICAHHGRLWNRHLQIKPKIPKNDPKWEGILPTRIYAILCMLRQLTEPVDNGTWWKAAREFLARTDGKPEMQDAMNVPENWATK